MRLITQLDRIFAKGEEILLALLLVGMVFLAALQVILRNFWDTGIDWGDVTLQHMTLLIGLLGAAIATSEGRHLTIDIFSRVLKGRAATALKIAIGIFSLILCLLLAQGGWRTFISNYRPWLENIPAGWSQWQNLKTEFGEGSIPPWLSQLLLPLGFGLMGFHFLLRLIRDSASLIRGKDWESHAQMETVGDAYLDELSAGESQTSPRGEP